MLRWSLVVAVVLTGCRRNARTNERDAFGLLLDRIDAIWDAGGPDRVEVTGPLLEEARALGPDRPALQWRTTRYLVWRGLGQVESRAALEDYGEARAVALRCLDAEPAFRRLRQATSWAAAVAALRDGREGCLVWGGFAWARWYALLGGEAAAIDLPAIDAVVAEAGRRRRGPTVSWSQALLAASRPERDGRDLDAAARAFEVALGGDVDDLSIRADLVELVLAPRRDHARIQAELVQLEAAAPASPEGRAALGRVRAAAP